jgi:hypothetical protein
MLRCMRIAELHLLFVYGRAAPINSLSLSLSLAARRVECCGGSDAEEPAGSLVPLNVHCVQASLLSQRTGSRQLL